MRLCSDEAPLAHAMVAIARDAVSPFSQFACYWMSFNSIYVIIYERRSAYRELARYSHGGLITISRAGIDVPLVYTNNERRMIEAVFENLPDATRHALVSNTHVEFFVNRTPRWLGHQICQDVKGNRVNGVIDVAQTVNERFPVCSAIDAAAYREYVTGNHECAKRDELAKQIIDMLRTIRTNIFYGGNRADDADDATVVTHAIPLLRVVIESYLQ